MGLGYQNRDAEIIDYQLWKPDDLGVQLRGPKPEPLENGGYIACVGAAQTFGCYVEHTYVHQIGEAIGWPVLNLGVAGAGPGFFLSRPAFLEKLNRSKLAVVQVMSGRSVANSLFDTDSKEMLTRRADGVVKGAAPMYADLLLEGNNRLISSVLHETRNNWVAQYLDLLERITVPKLLLWFAVRPPEYSARLGNVHEFFGDFPQLVNREMIDLIRPGADHYIECVSREGLPQKLYNRHTGEPTAIQKREDLGGTSKAFNDYYPSPEMHTLAATMLLECIETGRNSPVVAPKDHKNVIDKRPTQTLPRVKRKLSHYLVKILGRN
jgi:hypothetical protein